MHGETHFVTGISVGLGVAIAHGANDYATLTAAAAIGGVAALIPDWLQINIPGLNKSIKGATGHRGFSHWLLTAWLAAQAVYRATPLVTSAGLPPWTWLIVLAGWLSHIVLDMLAGGVPAFWPFFGRVTLARVKTGGKEDKFFGGGALVMSTLLVLSAVF
jgi:inner membrane protein